VQRDEDEAWRAIVDNYGERAALEPTEEVPEPSDERSEPADEEPELREEPVHLELVESDEGFVPPPPPPFPAPAPDRGLAWLGVFGAPAVLLISVLLRIALPSWLGWLLVAAFVGGFCYLVFTMPRTPREPWDDGAQV
jgi:hypothetical protein